MPERFSIILDDEAAQQELEDLDRQVARVSKKVAEVNRGSEVAREEVQSLVYQSRVLRRRIEEEFQQRQQEILARTDLNYKQKEKEILALLQELSAKVDEVTVKSQGDIRKSRFSLFELTFLRDQIILDTEMTIRQKELALQQLRAQAIQTAQRIESVVQGTYSVVRQFLSLFGETLNPVLSAIISAIFQVISAALTAAATGAAMGPYGVAMLAFGLAGAAVGVAQAIVSEQKAAMLQAQVEATRARFEAEAARNTSQTYQTSTISVIL